MTIVRILLLAPHPFYQVRGSSIAVDHVLKLLAQRGDQVDVLTYHEGGEKQYPNVTVSRIPALPFVHGIRPGFSWKKVWCDIFLFFKTLKFMVRHRYQIIHALEETVFIALVMKWVFRVPYLYDMDSSLPQQLVETYPWLRYLTFLLNFLERLAIQNAVVVLPVCDALASIALKYRGNNVMVAHDFPLLDSSKDLGHAKVKTELGIKNMMVMYVGNLEAYQGIEFLLESFSLALTTCEAVDLVIIGGERNDIENYKRKAIRLGIESRVHFLGPKPLEELPDYLEAADILVCPRIKGNNTPMKLYSYLWSEKPVLVTNIESHTQAVTNEVAFLADPDPKAFANGLCTLLGNEPLRSKLGTAGKKFVEERFSFENFQKKLNRVFDNLTPQ